MAEIVFRQQTSPLFPKTTAEGLDGDPISVIGRKTNGDSSGSSNFNLKV